MVHGVVAPWASCLTIVGGVRDAPVVRLRGRRKTLCARVALPALLRGPSTSPLGAMTALAPWAVVCGGFWSGFVGTFFVTTSIRYLYGSRRATTSEPQRHRRTRLLAVLGSLFGVFGLGYLAYSGGFTGEWGWFAVGFLLSITYMGALVFLVMRKARRKRASMAGA